MIVGYKLPNFISGVQSSISYKCVVFVPVGMAQLDARSSGRMGMRALVYYLTTTILAAIVGIIMVLLIHPGNPLIKSHVESKPDETKVSTLDAILDIVRSLPILFSHSLIVEVG